MPISIVTGPDGRDHSVSHRAGASDDEITALAKAQASDTGFGATGAGLTADDLSGSNMIGFGGTPTAPARKVESVVLSPDGIEHKVSHLPGASDDEITALARLQAWHSSDAAPRPHGWVDKLVKVARTSHLPAVAETLATVGSSMVSDIASRAEGVYEIGKQLANPKPIDIPAFMLRSAVDPAGAVVNEVRRQFTGGAPLDVAVQAGHEKRLEAQGEHVYIPRTPEGRKTMEMLGTAVGPATRTYDWLNKNEIEGWGNIAELVGGKKARPYGEFGGALVMPLLSMIVGAKETELYPRTKTGFLDATRMELSRVKGASRSGYSAADRALAQAALMEEQAAQNMYDDFIATSAEGADDAVQSATRSAQYMTGKEHIAKIKAAVDAMSEGDIDETVALADIDPKRVAAFRRFGVVPNPDQVSNDAAFREVAATVKTSNLLVAANETNSIVALHDAATEVVAKLAGPLARDRSVFDQALRDWLDTNMPKLQAQSGGLYDAVKNGIPADDLVETTNITAYIDDVVKNNLNRLDQLNPLDKAIYGSIKGGKVSYTILDNLRKEVGRGFEHLGTFPDADSAQLSQIYANLAKDQLAAATAHQLGNEYSIATILASQYKTLQEQTLVLFGRDGTMGSVNARITNAANSLVRGNVAPYNEFIGNVPTAMRKDAATQVLSQILSAGSRSGETTPAFATAFTALQRNKGAMDRLFVDLPAAAREDFEALGLMAQSIQRGLSRNNMSHTARDNFFNRDIPGIFGKIVAGSKQIPGVGSAVVAGEPVVKWLLRLKPRDVPSIERAGNMIRSAAFQQAMEEAAAGNVASANAVIGALPQFKVWAAGLAPADAAQVARLGFVGWLNVPAERAVAMQSPTGSFASPIVVDSGQDLSGIPDGSWYRDPNGRVYKKVRSRSRF